jgi:hypothetical protein
LGIHSADRLIPELQDLAFGEIIPLSTNGGPTVVSLEPQRALVLRFLMDPLTAKPVAPGDAYFEPIATSTSIPRLLKLAESWRSVRLSDMHVYLAATL